MASKGEGTPLTDSRPDPLEFPAKKTGRTPIGIRPVVFRWIVLPDRWSASAENERDDEQHEEYDENNLRDSDSGSSEPTEAEDGGDERDDEECNGPG